MRRSLILIALLMAASFIVGCTFGFEQGQSEGYAEATKMIRQAFPDPPQ